ncbi:MAG: MATE family efflux transporter, partial [Parasporobacterium sp.]|nr:MATE family efflux transporter [Parasporobacterium sp.]
VAAVGLTTQPIFLLFTLVMALNVGATALVARSKGAGDKTKAHLVMRQALLMTAVISAAMSIAGFVFAEPMVRFMGAGSIKQETIDNAALYLKIRMAGLLVSSLTATVTASLRGAGDSRTAMFYNVIANVVNVVFNYMMIYGHFGFPEMKVAGAAWATVIGQFAAFLIAMAVVMKKREKSYLHLRLQDGFRPDKNTLLGIWQIGLPSMLEQLIMRVGMVIFARTVAGLGDDALATHQVCMNIQALSFMMGQAFAVSATSLVGQSLGKGRSDMAKQYGTKTSAAGLGVSLLLAAFFFFLGKYVVLLYNNKPAVVDTGAVIMRFIAFTQPFQCVQFIQAGALRGAGDTRSTMIVTLVTVLILRTSIALILIGLFGFGLYGAWIALAADQLVRSLLIGIRYSRNKWMRFKVRG